MDGLVYVSPYPECGEFSMPVRYGNPHALDQNTGKGVWSFNTIKDTNAVGPSRDQHGGGAWSTAIDIRRGMTYWVIAQWAPSPGQNARAWNR